MYDILTAGHTSFAARSCRCSCCCRFCRTLVPSLRPTTCSSTPSNSTSVLRSARTGSHQYHRCEWKWCVCVVLNVRSNYFPATASSTSGCSNSRWHFPHTATCIVVAGVRTVVGDLSDITASLQAAPEDANRSEFYNVWFLLFVGAVNVYV